MHDFQCLSKGLDVSPLVEALNRNKALWTEITGRQDYEGSAHQDTSSIFLRWCKGLDINAAFTEIPAFNFPAMGKLAEAHELINYTLRRVSAAQLGRVLIVNLRQGGAIAPHADEGAYADHYERFHIALDSKPGNVFSTEHETVEMKTGELWWFNHKEKHQVQNLSGCDRLHMIIDCVAPMYRRERAQVSLAV